MLLFNFLLHSMAAVNIAMHLFSILLHSVFLLLAVCTSLLHFVNGMPILPYSLYYGLSVECY